MKLLNTFLIFLVIAIPSRSMAEESPCPPDYEACFTKEEYEKIVEAVEELDAIKKEKVQLEFKEPIVIVRDWEDRVYVNGGEKNPVKAHVVINPTIDREVMITLPTIVAFRPEPPEPQFAFRARLRANIGIMIPEIIKTANDGELYDFWSFGLDLDFAKLDIFNINAHLGSAGVGGGVGVDITKNFGININALCNWGEWTPTASMGAYFAFW